MAYIPNAYHAAENQTGQNAAGMPRTDFSKRRFLPADSPVTGSSVVVADSPLMPLIPAPKIQSVSQNSVTDFLKHYIGAKMRVTAALGSGGEPVNFTGVLMLIGADYIVLRPVGTNDLLMCDLKSIKLVNVFDVA